MAGAEAEFDEGAGIGSCFRLPALSLLIALHGGLCSAVPCAGGFSLHVMLANESFLDFAGARGINDLLTAFGGCFL